MKDYKNLKEEELLRLIQKGDLPKHVAIIMDGNGRWAKQRRLPRISGHKVGMDSVREVITISKEIGIKVLTLYAFSQENWKRPQNEVRSLMGLLRRYLRREIKTMTEKGIRLRAIGEIEKLPTNAREILKDAMEKTSMNKDLILNVALSYGGRSEIIEAVKRALSDIEKGSLSIYDLNETIFENYLETNGLPDPDLLIRTSGEKRISNFLLWQSAYTEFYFTDTLWPDFRKKELLLAILDYQQRERRFGLTREQIKRGLDAI
jgi:undecaprenyl diphosphate synthase